MANQIILKKSSVAAKVPLASDLAYGEVALNYQDGKLYYKKADNTIDSFLSSTASIAGVNSFNTRTGAITLTSSDVTTALGFTPFSNAGGSLTGSLTVGTGITGASNYLTLANPGIGYGNGFAFIRGTDAAGINVIETASDSTLYEMWMSDNPDGGDMMQWRFDDWQNANGLMVPIQTTGKSNRYVADTHSFWGSINQGTYFYTTSNFGGLNGSNKFLTLNAVSKLRVIGSTVDITAWNVSNYTGADGALVWVKLDTTTTFSWGYGSPSSGTIATGIPLSTTATLLSNNIYVTFSATTGAVGDTFTSRVWKSPTNALGTTQINGRLGIGTTPSGSAPLTLKSSLGYITFTSSGSSGTEIVFGNTSGTTTAKIQNNGGSNEILSFITSNAAASDLVTFTLGGSERIRFNGSGNIGINNTNPTEKLDVVGNIKHTGLVATDGTNVDQIKSITKSLTMTTDWQDAGINSTDLATGTYMVQLFANDTGSGGTNNNEYYSGTMSWYSGDTNSAMELPTDEITLHRAGGSGDGALYLRTYRTPTADANNLKLQIYSNTANASAANYVFKFRRII